MVRVALLGFQNMNRDPHYDYLQGMIESLVLYNLLESPFIDLVASWEAEEKRQSRETNIIWISGEYAFLGKDFQMSLFRESGSEEKTLLARKKGTSERMIHSLSEQLHQVLTNQEMRFGINIIPRNLLTLESEETGSLILYSSVPGAEVYIDDQFVGYTEENGKSPLQIHHLTPGTHLLRTHHWPYGQVDLPEMRFRDWTEEITIGPGQEIVIRAEQRPFNDLFDELQQLIRGNHRFNYERKEVFHQKKNAAWFDLRADEHELFFELNVVPRGEELFLNISLSYDREPYEWDFALSGQKALDWTEEVKDVEIRLYWSRGRLDYSIVRTDIEQGMWNHQ